MSEREILQSAIRNDKKKAADFATKLLPTIKNPVARFNLDLQPHHWHPSVESGLSMLPTYNTEGAAEAFKSPQKIADPETGQKFRVVRLNWQTRETLQGDEPDNEQIRPLMYVPEYGLSVANEGAPQLRAEELVRQTGRPVFSIDFPGWGSDSLTPIQKRSLKADGGYGPIAEAQLRVMKEMGITDVDIVGQSIGGWAASVLAEKAEQLGVKVHHLIVMEAPIDKMSVTNLIKAEAGEARLLELYYSVPYDQRLREVSGHFNSALRIYIDLAKWSIGNTLKGGFKYIKAMSKGTLEVHIDNALQFNPDLHVQMVHGTEGKVSPAESNRSLVQRLRDKYQDRIHRSVYPGDSHSFMNNPQKFGTAVKLSLQPLRKK